jgi:hypothetical protein
MPDYDVSSMTLWAVVLLLAGEQLHIDNHFGPQFSSHQMQNTAEATRIGLARWAATVHGRKILEYFAATGCEIEVIEDDAERGIGRAPEPGIATLVAASTHRLQHKRFEIILNPTYYRVPKDMFPLAGQPGNTADAMSIAWAGEMLHIYFYAHGISLPHHPRADFQEEWRAVATELGMGTVPHDDDDEFAHSVIVRYVGYGR